MKKIALMVASCLAASAAQAGPVGETVSASGTVSIVDDCAITMSLTPEKNLLLSQAKHQTLIATMTMGGCKGKAWVRPGESDGHSYGVMRAGDIKAGYAIIAPDGQTTWGRHEGKNYLVRTWGTNKGETVAYRLELSENTDNGLPTKGGDYSLTVIGGEWQD